MFWKRSFSIVLLAIIVKCEPPPETGYGAPYSNNNNFGQTNYGPPAPPAAQVNNFIGNNEGYGNDDYHGNGNGNSYGHEHHEGADYDHSEPKSYEFGYAVKDDYTGNDYKRREQSDGNQVQGEYRVQLPDGRTQIVTYYADWKTGFHADVRYEGEAQYPQHYNTYGNQGNQGNDHYNTYNNHGNQGNNYGNYNGGAASDVNIKDLSGPGAPYNTGHFGNSGISNGGHYDTYANNELTGNRAPNSHYGVPH